MRFGNLGIEIRNPEEIELAPVVGSMDEESQWKPAEGPLVGPQRRSDWRRYFEDVGLRRALVLAGVISLAAIGVFMLGNVMASAGCGSGATGGPDWGEGGDTVAPEGHVSSSFEARHDYRGRPRVLTVAAGVVAADHGRCSAIGAAALEEGGNAVDAAVATALCQGVYNPMASGVGGGHIMIIRLPNGTADVIDAREVAPLAANETMFKGHPQLSLVGGLAAGVPLELLGLHLAHLRHGVLPWARLVQPAAEVAESGFAAHPYLVSALRFANFSAQPELQRAFFVQERTGGSWRPPKVNETCCRRPRLAQLLNDVAASGPRVLYTGKYAAAFARDIQAAGGIITAQDLAQAKADVKPALRNHVMGVDLLAPPPPSSAVTIVTALLVLAGYDLPLAGSGSLGVHRVTEAMKHAFALRMSLGDPGPDPAKPFVPHLAELLQDMQSTEFAAKLRGMLVDDGVLNTTAYGGEWNVLRGGALPEDHGTSHLSVVDAQRMAVALTSTVNTGFGSKVMSPSTGILLNNQMDDFSTPGQPNVYGLPPSPSNFIVPGKKPFSSMSPLVVEQGGQLRAVLGASGGPRIISAVLQTLLRVLARGEDAFSAVAGPRVHHQLAPNTLYAEGWAAGGAQFYYDNTTLHGLEERGHQVARSAWGAVVQAVLVDYDVGAPAGSNGGESQLRAVSDPRKDGAPAGY